MGLEDTTDADLAAALRSERTYEDQIYRSRAYLGTAGALSKGFLNFLASDPLNYDDPARDEYYKSLQTLDPVAQEARESRKQTAVAQATQRARGVGREAAGLLAADPTKAAGVLQGLKNYETAVTQAEGQKQTTLNMKADAAEKVMAAGEMKRIEDAKRSEAEAEDAAKRERKFALIGSTLDAGFQLASAARPQTKEAKLEDTAVRTGKRADRLAKKSGVADERNLQYLTESEGKTGRLATRYTAAQTKAEAASTELATLEAAKLAKEQERLRALAPFSAQLAALMGPPVPKVQ